MSPAKRKTSRSKGRAGSPAKGGTKNAQITVSIDRKIAEEFSDLIKELNLRRDQYLAAQLASDASVYLTEVTPASSRGLKAYRMLRGFNKDLVRLTITLDEKNAELVTRLCDEKQIPRDAFVERCIEDLIDPLQTIASLMFDPRAGISADFNPYQDLAWNDADVDDLVAKLQEKAAAEGKDDD